MDGDYCYEVVPLCLEEEIVWGEDIREECKDEDCPCNREVGKND